MFFTDPIVKEMRDAGKKIQDKCNNNLHLFSQMITEGTEKHKKEGWKVVTKKDIENKIVSR